MTLSKAVVISGEEITATVIVKNVPPGSPGPSAKWRLGNSPVTNGTRINIRSTNDADSKTFTSTLRLTPDAIDDGNISCTLNVQGWLEPVTETRWLSVLGPPSVTISNNTAAVSEGENITLTCTATVRNTSHPNSPDPVKFEWSRASGSELKHQTITNHPDKGLYIYTSYITQSPTESVLYSCKAKNLAGWSQVQTCRVIFIKKEIEKCSAKTARDIYWPTMLKGEESKAKCLGKFTGEVSRRCLENENWEEPDFSQCIPVVYAEMRNEVEDMKDGVDPNPERTQKVAEQLTAPTKNLTQPATLKATVEIISDLANIHETLDEPPSRAEVVNILGVISALVEPEHKKLWKTAAEEDRTKEKEEAPAVSGVNIMEALEKYAKALTKGDITNEPNETTFRTNNIVLVVESRQVSSAPVEYPSKLQDTTDEITIPAATLKQVAASLKTTDVVITVINYKSLGDILPSRTKDSDYQNASISSRIQSISIKSLSSDVKFNIPIQLFFETNGTTMDGRTPLCTAWDGSLKGSWSSEGCDFVYSDNGTLCKCSHMTNFAVLFAHYNPKSVHHNRVLEIITIVGCSISILCMLITIITYCTLWKYLKAAFRGNMFRAYMLVNLCCVLSAANLLFMAGVKETKIGGGCVAIAAILHYLFLVAFTSMLVTSLNLLRKLVNISKGVSGDTTKDLIIGMTLSWGVPCIIVAVSLSVTQSTDKYRDKLLCWLSKEEGTLWAFVGPVIVVILVNTLIMIRVMWFKVRSSLFRQQATTTRSDEEGVVRSALWSFAVLGPIVGFSWILGVMITNSKKEIVMQYLFVLFNSTQGIFIFVFHCAMEKNVRKAFESFKNTIGPFTTSFAPKTKTFWFNSRSDKTSSSEGDTTILKKTGQESIEIPSPTESTFSSGPLGRTHALVQTYEEMSSDSPT